MRLSTLHVHRENNTAVSMCMIFVCAAHVLASAATCVSQLFLGITAVVSADTALQQQTCRADVP